MRSALEINIIKQVEIIYKSILWLLQNVLKCSPSYFIISTILGGLSKGLTVVSMVASLRGLIFVFKLDQEPVNFTIFGLMDEPLSRTALIIIIGFLIFLLYALNAICNYFSDIYIEKCNLQAFQNVNSFNKLNVLSQYKGEENQKTFEQLSHFYSNILPVTIVDLSKLIYISVILVVIFIVIGFINIMIALAILLMSSIVLITMAKNTSKDIRYLTNIQEFEKNDKKMNMGEEYKHNPTKKDISNYFTDSEAKNVFKDRASLRLLNTANESIYFLIYGVLMFVLILSFIAFDTQAIQLEPIYILLLIFSMRYGLAYSRLFGQSLARILRIRIELKIMNII